MSEVIPAASPQSSEQSPHCTTITQVHSTGSLMMNVPSLLHSINIVKDCVVNVEKLDTDLLMARCYLQPFITYITLYYTDTTICAVLLSNRQIIRSNIKHFFLYQSFFCTITDKRNGLKNVFVCKTCKNLFTAAVIYKCIYIFNLNL